MTDGLFDDESPVDTAPPAVQGPFGRAAAWLADRLIEERDRWFLWTPVGLGFGVAAYFLLPTEPPGWMGAALTGVAAVLAWALRRWTLGLAVALAILAVAVGFASAQGRTAFMADPMLRKPIGPVLVTGRVEIVDRLPEGARLVLRELSIERLAPKATPGRVRLRLPGRLPLPEAGTVVRLRAMLTPPPAPPAPGGFDFQRNAFFDGIGGSGFVLSAAVAVEGPPPTLWRAVMIGVERLRERIFERCRAALPEPEASMTAALLNGEQTGIPKPVMDDMRASGLSHLLSVSGLHVALVAGLVFAVLRGLLALIEPLALRWPIKKIAAVGGILAAAGYLLVVGPQAPMLRSVLMSGMVMAAVLVDRTTVSLRVIVFAGLTVLLIQPEGMLGPSFQMSFGAVLALISAFEVMAPTLRRWQEGAGWPLKTLLYFTGVALSSVVATLATTPFSLFHFQQVALYGVLSNMLAVPVTSFWVMPWGLLAYVLLPMGWEEPALVAMGWGVTVVIWTAHLTAGLPGATLLVPAMPLAGLVAIVLGGLWLALWSGRWRLWGLVPVLLGLISPVFTVPPDVLVAGDGKLLAVRAADGRLSLSSATAARFIANAWLKRDGVDTPSAPWPRGGRSTDGRLACDALGCVYRKDGRTVALSSNSQAQAEDCGSADAVVNLEPARHCRAPLVIDRWALLRGGTHALYVTSGGVRAESVRERRGQRPWTVP
ncbi:ComEC/Rec2 family competence protein [Azospirillum sp. sgz301742]